MEKCCGNIFDQEELVARDNPRGKEEFPRCIERERIKRKLENHMNIGKSKQEIIETKYGKKISLERISKEFIILKREETGFEIIKVEETNLRKQLINISK